MIKVVKGVRKGNFEPFDATNLEEGENKTSKKDFKYVVTTGSDKATHYVGLEELCALHEDNPSKNILQKQEGKKFVAADIDDEARLNPDVEIGRDAQGMLVVI